MNIQQTVFSRFYFFLNKFRTYVWRFLLNGESGRFSVFGRIKVYYPENVCIGNGSKINEGVLLNAQASITIGEQVHLSSYCVLNTGGLDVSRRREERLHLNKQIIIRDGVWIGSGVLINPGVTIGADSVVGAGSVVTKDVPPGVVVVGNPATFLKKIDFEGKE